VSEVLPETFESFVARRHLALVRFAHLLTGRDQAGAEDVVQTVLLRLLAAGTWDRVANPEAYLRRGIVNEWRSQARDLSRRDWSGEVPDRPVADGTEHLSLHDWVWGALEGLTGRQRAAVVMRYYLDAPDAEIAGALGCSRATVRSLVHRALPRIAAALADSPHPEEA